MLGNVSRGASVSMQQHFIYHLLCEKQTEKLNRFYHCISEVRTLKVQTNWPAGWSKFKAEKAGSGLPGYFPALVNFFYRF